MDDQGALAHPSTKDSPSHTPAGQGTAVCVLGAPRSGASLTAGVLQRLGVDFGDERGLPPPDAFSPRGSFELPPIVAINRAVLDAIAATDQRSEDWQDRREFGAVQNSAERLIGDRFGSSSLWGWKDPQTCLTLPFWQRIIGEVSYVICIRNPLDAAQSLQAVDGERRRGQLLSEWTRYTALALEQTSGYPRLVVDYDEFLGQPTATIRRLARFVGLEAAADDAARSKALEHFVDPSLALFRSGPDATSEESDSGGGDQAIALYRALRELSRPELDPEEGTEKWRAAETLAHDLHFETEPKAPGIEATDVPSSPENTARLRDLERGLDEAEAELKARKAALADAETREAERARAAADAERAASQLRDRVTDLESELAASEADRGAAEQRAANLAAQLEDATARSGELEEAVGVERDRATQLESEVDRLRHQLEQRDAATAELEARATELQKAVARELEHVAGRDQRLVEAHSEKAELLGHVERLKAALEERDGRLANLKRFLQEEGEDFHFRDAQQQQLILAMRRSRSWRITKPLRGAAITTRALTGRGDRSLKP